MAGGGDIVYGSITKEMVEGEPVWLDTETIKRNVLHDWISWLVESVEQDWRTWRINTRQGGKVATYEAIPLPSEKHKKIDYGKIRA